MSARIGVDLGGTKIEGLVLGRNGRERLRRRVRTPPDYERTVEAVVALVRGLERDGARGASVGVGIPGAESPETGRIKNANSTWLIGRPLARDLGRRLERPVRLMNDANCFALSEAVDGAGRGAHCVFGVIVGTGVGGGVVLDGRVREGVSRIAGEWGHNPLPWPEGRERPGPPCYCGRRGCVETFCSGPGLERDHREATGRSWEVPRIASRAADGDPGAREALARHAHRMARGLATVINILDPDVIVLGGGVSNLPGLADRVQRELAPWVFDDEVRARVVRNCHGDSSGVRGAAWLWPRAGTTTGGR